MDTLQMMDNFNCVKQNRKPEGFSIIQIIKIKTSVASTFYLNEFLEKITSESFWVKLISKPFDLLPLPHLKVKVGLKTAAIEYSVAG